GFRDSCETDRPAATRIDKIRMLLIANRMPFVVTVRRDQAAPPANGIAKRRLLAHCLGAGVDYQRECTRVLDPAGKKAPAHQTEVTRSLLRQHDRNGLRRRDVVTSREIRLFAIVERSSDRPR